MKPPVNFLDGRVVLHLGDCHEVLPDLAKADAIVTDPPYGIRYKPGQGGRSTTPHGRPGDAVGKRTWGDSAVQGDDGVFDPAFLLDLPVDHRILWGANNYANALPNRQGWLFWDKYLTSSSLSFAEGEFAWTDLPITARGFRHLWNGVCKDSETGQARVHPTQKPVALLSWCIGLLPEAETILDPFAGSGTTGIAAVKLGKRFIGIESEPAYFNVMVRRISEAIDQPDLFIRTPASELTQADLLAEVVNG